MKPETLTILKNFSGINKSIRFDASSRIMIFNPNINFLAYADVEDEFPLKFSIYDLNQLLSTLALFDEPKIEYEQNQMVIRGNRMSAKYRYSAPQVTSDQVSHIPTIPDNEYSFELSKEQLNEVMKAASVLGLKEVQFSKDSIKAFNTDDSGKVLDNEYESEIEDLNIINTDTDLVVKIKVEALKLIPVDYTVFINEKCVIFKSKHPDYKVTYYSALIVG